MGAHSHLKHFTVSGISGVSEFLVEIKWKITFTLWGACQGCCSHLSWAIFLLYMNLSLLVFCQRPSKFCSEKCQQKFSTLGAAVLPLCTLSTIHPCSESFIQSSIKPHNCLIYITSGFSRLGCPILASEWGYHYITIPSSLFNPTV